MEVTNNLLAFLVIIAMVVTITGTLSMLSLMPGLEVPITGMAQSTAYGLANVSLPAEANIQLTVALVNFGNIAAVPGTEETTMYLDPYPFELKNNGTATINVSIAEANATGEGLLWDRDDNGTYFEYNCTKNESTSVATWYAPWTAFNDAHEAGSFVTEPANLDAAPNANLVWNLSSKDTEFAVKVHINVTVPTSEPYAVKQATVLFNAELG